MFLPTGLPNIHTMPQGNFDQKKSEEYWSKFEWLKSYAFDNSYQARFAQIIAKPEDFYNYSFHGEKCQNVSNVLIS